MATLHDPRDVPRSNAMGPSAHSAASAAQPPGAVLAEPENRDRRLEEVVRPVLRYGSLLSVAIITLGVALALWSAHWHPPSLAATAGTTSQQASPTPAGLISSLATGDAQAIITLGLLVLIATPVLRVASTVLYFLWKRDRTYLAVTSFVLLVLLLGFVVGGRG